MADLDHELYYLYCCTAVLLYCCTAVLGIDNLSELSTCVRWWNWSSIKTPVHVYFLWDLDGGRRMLQATQNGSVPILLAPPFETRIVPGTVFIVLALTFIFWKHRHRHAPISTNTSLLSSKTRVI